MLSVIALVGRPNIGKSTLFNYLTRSRDALVADYPGLTRDRQYGRVKRGNSQCLVVDTGGIADAVDGGINIFAEKQVQIALDEADVILFLVDAHEGLNASDEAIAVQLRKLGKSIVLVANKVDGLNSDIAGTEFYALGLGDPVNIAAIHGRNVGALLSRIDHLLPAQIESIAEQDQSIDIAVVGRPNVGKSTLVNRLLGEERVVVFDQPGTTRDSVFIPFERDGKMFTLIDTAGMRRRSRVSEAIEKFSIIKSMQAIERANVVIYLIDASEGITDQDASLLGLVLEAGRSLVIGLNKWDGLDKNQRNLVRKQIETKLPFLDFAEKHPISALHGSGVGKLFDAIHIIYDAAMLNMSTPQLTSVLQDALVAHQPPLVKARRIKLKYAHQGGHNPPIVVIHGNQTDALPVSYKRFLMNFFRQRLKLAGTPVRIQFKSSDNPFKGTRSFINERPLEKRKRIIKRQNKAKNQ